MTQNKRILLNVLATYGRSLYAMAIGIFTSRWILAALGEVDYGLVGVVGGLTSFITFFNTFLSSAIGRYYAFSIGRAQVAVNAREGLEECRRWFSIAVLIHTVVPVILVIIGYPFGMWAVDHFLNIPSDRLVACEWMFRFVCISCLVGMINVPFQAMYTAKQYIAELTLYSFATTTINFFFFFWMVSHPGNWLMRYSFWSMLITVVPQLIIAWRAMVVFPECRFRFKYCKRLSDIRQLIGFAGWQIFSSIGTLASGQGVAIVINKYFGPSVNAAMSIANTVKTHSNSLSAALVGAFMPAITTSCGAGDYDLMRNQAFRACKFGLVLALLFMLPLSLELPSVIKLWLGNPPDHVSILCLCMLITLLIDKSTCGHHAAIMAHGKIAAFQVASGLCLALSLPISVGFVVIGLSVDSVGYAFIVSAALYTGCRLIFAHRFVQMSIRRWVVSIMLPMTIVSIICTVLPLIIRIWMSPGVVRIMCSSIFVEALFVPLVWFFVLDADERAYAWRILQVKILHKGV